MENQTLQQCFSWIPKPSLLVQILGKVVTLALLIAQIVIGALYLDKCPVQPMIPMFLVVSGAFGLALGLLWDSTENDQEGGVLSNLSTLWNAIVSLFLFCWFIAGNVWIYSIYQPNYDPQIPLYCNKTVYLFAFWVITFEYILVGFLLLACCCNVCCLFLCSGDQE